MRHLLFALFLATSLSAASNEVLSKEEVLSGTKSADPKEERRLFDSFSLTHEWKGVGDIRVRIWEAPGHWPGRFPVLVQIWSESGKLLDASELELPGARPVKFWAFFQMGSHLVVNLECEHRFHHGENAIYAFRVRMDDRWVSGGPAVPLETIRATRRFLPDLLSPDKGEGEKAVPEGDHSSK
ncbi:MAG: hypothetical protein EOP83_17545 [Verrucomicrobiaceae bacterium]|nr:MAG: hypothetical protein EOP83_17545 [Verrucomicrobiaceae bacterium]